MDVDVGTGGGLAGAPAGGASAAASAIGPCASATGELVTSANAKKTGKSQLRLT